MLFGSIDLMNGFIYKLVGFFMAQKQKKAPQEKND